MGTLRRVRAVELLPAAGALLGASAVLVALAWARRRRALAPAVARLARAIPEALGDALLVAEGGGRIVEANDAALVLAGGALVGRDLASLGSDLAVLSRGLARGPASGIVTLSPPAGRLRARAALLRVSTRPPRDLVVLRPLAPSRPPPLPPPGPAPRRERPAATAPAAAEARAVVAAAAAAVRDPVARAARAAALLRLCAPALAGRAAGALQDLEAALADADRRGAALAAAGEADARRGVDLAALVEELAGALAPPPGVALRVSAAPARALADERPLRAALRELLRCAAEALPAGGEIAVAVRGGAAGPLVEIAPCGAGSAPLAALARALLAPQGARVEEETRRVGGPLVRIVLPPALAEPVVTA